MNTNTEEFVWYCWIRAYNALKGKRRTNNKWAMTWQNRQSECALSEDSDQPGHPPSLIRVFAVRMKTAWVHSYPLSAQRRLRSAWASAQSDQSLRCPHEECLGPQVPIELTAKTLIRLGGCPGWFESSLGAHSVCWFCHIAAQMKLHLISARTW